jgi:hypothetical protein
VNECTAVPFCWIEPLNVSVASVATAVGDVVVLSESEPHAGSHDNESTTIAGNHARKAGPFFI